MVRVVLKDNAPEEEFDKKNPPIIKLQLFEPGVVVSLSRTEQEMASGLPRIIPIETPGAR